MSASAPGSPQCQQWVLLNSQNRSVEWCFPGPGLGRGVECCRGVEVGDIGQSYKPPVKRGINTVNNTIHLKVAKRADI